MNEFDKYDFFWGGPFSNWYPSNFIVDGITFNCGEQFMMYEKAMTFGDIKTAKEIMSTNNPSAQKALGRKVKNYDDKVWAEVRFEKVKRGLLEKYKIEPFYSYLKERKDKIIVEASPYDRIWGIGYDENDPKILEEKDKWGENLLGKCIMEIAKELFN
jgi:ribA/ribD-fused uncharacterized protein